MRLKNRIAHILRPFVDRYCPTVPFPTPVIREHIAFERLQVVEQLNAGEAIGIIEKGGGPLKKGALYFRDSTYKIAQRAALEIMMGELIHKKFIEVELSEDGCQYKATLYAVKPDDVKSGRKQLEAEFVPTDMIYQ